MSWSLSSLGFDAYERRARLYPGLIAIFPFILLYMVLVPNEAFGGVGRMVVAIVAYVGILYLLVNIARSAGKRIEPRLLNKWGGWPTTVLLRHRDNTIDPHTKQRYHNALAKIASGLSIPSPGDERHSPSSADDIYRSATKLLVEKRRGEKYRLVSDANAEYGFRRNMLGLKPLAIFITAIVACIIFLVWWLPLRTPLSEHSLLFDLKNRWKVYGLFLGNLSVTAFWTGYVREPWVRQSGFAYARALFRTLE